MESELLAIVDDKDQVIGTGTRHLIHATGLKHRAVHILLFNQQGQLFLQKRSMSKDVNPGLWDTSVAGHVDAGEDYLDSAIREIGEELGITTAIDLQLLFKLTATADTGMEFIQVYRCCHDGPLVLATNEIDQGAWFASTEINERVAHNDPSLTSSFKLIWRIFTHPYQNSIGRN